MYLTNLNKMKLENFYKLCKLVTNTESFRVIDVSKAIGCNWVTAYRYVNSLIVLELVRKNRKFYTPTNNFKEACSKFLEIYPKFVEKVRIYGRA